MRKLKLLLTMLVLLVGGVSSANAETDYTSSITNPNFSTNADGWTITGNAQLFNGKGFDGDKFMELTNWGSSWDATISQTVTELPNGYYKVKAAGQMSGVSDCWMKLVANGAENYFSRNGDTKGNILADGTETTIGGEGVQAGWRYSSVIAKVTDGTLVISCVGHSDVKERWANFDHVTLTYLGESIAAGTDVSDFINNWDFWGCFNNAFNGWTIETTGGNTWVHGDTAVEFWNNNLSQTFDYHQTVTNLPKGKYLISASMWNTQGTPNGNTGVYGTNSEDFTVFAGVTDDCDDNNLHTYTTDGIVVKDGTLRIGVKNNGERSSNWFGVDWIKLTYQDPFISAIATEIPAATATALTAGKWYKFTAASTGDHSFDATAIANISCTSTDQLLSEATGTAATATMALTGGTTYYIKSSSAQSLTITPQSFTYTVGDGTPSVADNKYTQSKTFTLTFADAATDDPAGTFQILDATKITVNSVQATASLTDKVLTITLAEALTASTDYAISVAAGAMGYNTDNVNTAINLTVKTPAVFDGHFYIKKNGADLFFSRGGDENKQTVLDQFGVPVKITTDESNVSRVKFIDTGLLLGASGSSTMYWTDKGTGTPAQIDWTITKSGDKYKFYLLGMDDAKKGMNIHTNGTEPKSDAEANACDWELELPAAHPAKLQAVKDAQAAAVATAMGIDGVTTQAGMKTYLEDNYVETAIAITGTGGTNKEAWQQSAPIVDPFEYVVFAEETVNGLIPGLYRLRVHAFERIAGGQTVYDAGGAAGLAYVYATSNGVTEKVKLASLFDVQSDTPWKSGNDLQFGGKYYANGQDGAQAAFNAGKYANDVYVKVVDEGSGTGSIKFGIKQPNAYYSGSSVHNNSQWICYNNFSLTHFINSTKVTVTDAGYATYVSSLPLDYTSTDIKAYTAKADAGKVVLTQINKVPANTPVILYKEGGATEDIPVATSTDTPAASDLVAGTGAAVATADGDYTNYILNNGSNGIGFYLANGQTVAANRAYLHVPNSEKGSESRMTIVFDDQATGIADLKAAAKGDAIYNLNGQRIEKATKGIYIIGGKKMMKK